jgi:hypothetical protein
MEMIGETSYVVKVFKSHHIDAVPATGKKKKLPDRLSPLHYSSNKVEKKYCRY